jgi:prevent-host-death family protein
MRIVNIHEAKTHLSRLVDEAVKGVPFVIAKAGKPLVKVIALNAPSGAQIRRLGFLAGQITVPEDFDRMSSASAIHSEGGRMLTGTANTGREAS